MSRSTYAGMRRKAVEKRREDTLVIWAGLFCPSCIRSSSCRIFWRASTLRYSCCRWDDEGEDGSSRSCFSSDKPSSVCSGMVLSDEDDPCDEDDLECMTDTAQGTAEASCSLRSSMPGKSRLESSTSVKSEERQTSEKSRALASSCPWACPVVVSV